ncbi:sugar kinase [Frondihabitans sp. PAMC 28766]|uniref:PfkB family carbohydrate kinase n=1 Tax=Frondihabitans sp. PAMC 28766 TaxID=1795630 RepID=UPI00078C4EB7|nr:PfkB family carbohydrate kinase [Frondihabitans sp. PAMC 28766]AMM21983.1 sugar kinase [Frondihabitans sp. PAMC 28766]
MTRLLHTGNAIVDVALTIDSLPEPGGDVLASSSAITAGGAVNTMVAAVRDGLETLHLGARGAGPFAAIVARALGDAGIRAVGPVVDVDTGYSVVLIDPSTERTFVTHVGAESRLTRAALDAVEVRDDDIVVVSGYSLAHSPDVLPGWVAALPAGVRVVFDPSPLVASLSASALDVLLARADIVTANAREAGLIAGAPPAAPAAGSAADLAARVRPGAAVLVRNGSAGCWLVDGGAPVLVPGFAVTAVDSTGAGDAHCGVLCAALSRGDSLPDAVRRANAAAALAVSRRGPATSPTSAEIEALLAR